MTTTVAAAELEMVGAFQEELHTTTDGTEKIFSILYRENEKVTRVTTLPIKMEPVGSEGVFHYTVNTSADYLMYTTMRIKLPHVQVKPGFTDKVRVAWCHNVAHNKIIDGRFYCDNTPLQKIDNHWLDIDTQFYQNVGEGKRVSDQVGIGNIRTLESWNSELPATWLNVEHPWFYSVDSSTALPLHKGSTTCKFSHRYRFRKSTQLLRVQGKSKGEWVDLPQAQWLQFIMIDGDSEPELWGRYAYASADELCHHDLSNRYMYTQDVEICDQPTHYKLTDLVPCKISTVNPCLAAFWMALNVDAEIKSNYSNYSTNTNDLYHGTDPITTTSFMYGTEHRFEKMDSDHFNIGESRHHFPSAPNEPGYHGLSLTYDSSIPGPAFGVVLEKRNAELQIQLGNALGSNSNENSTNIIPLDDIDEIKDDRSIVHNAARPMDTTKYRIIIRLLVLKKISIRKVDGKFIYEIV